MVGALTSLVAVVIYVLLHVLRRHFLLFLLAVSCLVLSGIVAILSYIVFVCFLVPLQVLREVAKTAKGFEKLEVLWCMNTIKAHMLAVMASLATTLLLTVGLAIFHTTFSGEPYARWALIVLTDLIDSVCNAFCALVVSGLFLPGSPKTLVADRPSTTSRRATTPADHRPLTPAEDVSKSKVVHPGSPKTLVADRPSTTSRRATTPADHRPLTPAEDVSKRQGRSYHEDLNQEDRRRWDEKVSQLAERSMTVKQLLEFCGSLGCEDIMHHYDIDRSTTNDVVRQAIIPRSTLEDGSGGRCFADVVNEKEGGMPQHMVTHCWSNSFSHLVAAIVASRKDKACYESYVHSLGTPELLHNLGDKASERYWICAFCVNQHSSICGGFSPEPSHGTQEHSDWDSARRDTVTNNIYPLCKCGQPKYFNDSLVECELNKFDSVMKTLSLSPNISQVVATDLKFEVFERAWCVAELVEADDLKIRQELILYNRGCLHTHCQRLTQLSVHSCKASRKEDKEDIINKIGDTVAFDKHLQNLLFRSTGLLRTRTNHMDQLSAVARILEVQASPD
eukprot:CAMPEP_0172930790 /NCGR_PEP_ID=MMETSP1075-20121228/219167_1 /TAXON_ID=2916 /ORGANISM="Ceratium fusus, Strain PA161109" /LENGTH=562 /DNA_ID=CAMNT_0013792103 /DNA_START=802 /DNA_END=2491 /DNA_ORIENTATION=-